MVYRINCFVLSVYDIILSLGCFRSKGRRNIFQQSFAGNSNIYSRTLRYSCFFYRTYQLIKKQRTSYFRIFVNFYRFICFAVDTWGNFLSALKIFPYCLSFSNKYQAPILAIKSATTCCTNSVGT